MSLAESDKRAPGSASVLDYTPTGFMINALSGDLAVYDESGGSAPAPAASAPKNADLCHGCGYRRMPGGTGPCPGCAAKRKLR